MCVFVSGFVFQAIPNEAVRSDVSSPNQCDEESHSDVSPEAQSTKGERQCVGMDDIIAQTADSSTSEIPDHR